MSLGRLMRVERVDLPEPLVEAHASGELALFVGAGASVDTPANLPRFDELACEIANRTVGSSLDEGDPARLLDRLCNEYDINVHAEIRTALTERRPSPNPTHEAIAQLARSVSDLPRIVTTNYDTLLSRCLPETTRTYEYPDLPGRGDFTGVVHLHGSLNTADGMLVATDSDLADAYMGTRAVGTLFLERLFDRQAVLFLGYSLDDVLVRYLLKAQTTKSEMYTLTTKPNDPRWRELRVRPVGVDSYRQLPRTLSVWAEYAASGISGEAHRVGEIVAAGPPQRQDDDDAYIRKVLQDPHRVGLFTGRAQESRWLTWVAGTLHPDLLFMQSGDVTEAQRELQGWLVRCVAEDDYNAKAALDLIRGHPGVIPDWLWEVLWILRSPRRTTVSADLRRQLLLAFADAAPGSGAHLLVGVIDKCQPDVDDSLVLEVFSRLHSPRIRDTSRGRFSPFDREFLSSDLRHRFRHLASDLMVIADHRLQQDARRNDINAQQSRFRQAIESHPQNDPLVDAARDLLDILRQDRPEEAASQIRAWEQSQWPILRRLALYGHTVRDDITADAKLAVLISHPTLLVDHDLHHEVMTLIAAAVPYASPSAVDNLVGLVRDQETSDRIRYDKLGWIAQLVPASQSARGAFDAEQAAHPDFRVSDHPDFLVYIESIVTDGLPDEYRADLPNLAALMDGDPASALDHILSHYTGHASAETPGRRWLDALRVVRTVTEDETQACLSLLEALVSYQSPRMQAVSAVARAALMSLEKAARQDDRLLVGIQSRELLARLWSAASEHWPQPDPGTRERDWMRAAANSCAGIIAQLIMLSIRPQQRDSSGGSLAPEDANLVELILRGDTAASNHAQVVCAQHLWWLHSLDRPWAGRHVLALLDPADRNRAFRCWQGYLYHPRWNDEIIDDGLLEHLLAFAPSIDQCGDNPRRGFARLTVGISLYSTTPPLGSEVPWLKQLASTSSEQTRVAFIRALGHELSNLSPEQRRQQWDRWVNRYLSDRVNGEPKPLSPLEATTTALVGTLLPDLFPEVVDIVALTPAPLAPAQAILRLLTDRRDEATESESTIAEQHPHATAKLLAHMLARPTRRVDIGSWELNLQDVYETLNRLGAVTTELEQQVTRLDLKPPAHERPEMVNPSPSRHH